MNGHLKDPRVVDSLVMKGYMELEETTLQVRGLSRSILTRSNLGILPNF